jgi:transposase
MVHVMEARYGQSNRVWVMDRGMVSEGNLEFMRTSNTRYLVGTPKSLLKKFERELLSQKWEEVGPGVEVNLVQSPEGKDETFVLCRSLGRKEKENAILNRFVTRLEEKPTKLAGEAHKGRIRDRQKVARQIGRLLERNSRAASLFTVTVTEKDGHITVLLTSKRTKNASGGLWKTGEAISSAPTGQKLIQKPFGTPIYSLPKLKMTSVPQNMIWE